MKKFLHISKYFFTAQSSYEKFAYWIGRDAWKEGKRQCASRSGEKDKPLKLVYICLSETYT